MEKLRWQSHTKFLREEQRNNNRRLSAEDLDSEDVAMGLDNL
jgi:hypothetical protein